MKAVLSIFAAVVTLVSSTSFASGTGDIGSGNERKIVAQCNNVALDLEVSVQGKLLLIDITGGEGTTVRYSRELKENEVINGNSLTTYAINRVIDTHNVIGTGPMISINGSEAYLADGAIHVLDCRQVK